VSACRQAYAERAQSAEVVDVGRLGCGPGDGDVWEVGFEVLPQASLLADAPHAFRVHPQDPFGQSVFGQVGHVLGPRQAALDGEVRGVGGVDPVEYEPASAIWSCSSLWVK